jgi:hypothetical protein
MSYDLMVFEPEAAPKDHDAFMDWYTNLTNWNDGPYDDPARTSARLRAWVQEMRRMFPDMNTPEAEIHLQDDDGVLADYTIGRQFVYAGFAWSKAVAAAGEAERLAKLRGVECRREFKWRRGVASGKWNAKTGSPKEASIS